MKTQIIHGKKIRKKSFRFWFHGFIKLFVRRTKFVYLGEKLTEPSILLSNHAGVSAPFGFELFFEEPFRMWGTYQMTKGLKSVYKYYSEIFLKRKHGYGDFKCKLLGMLFSPFANGFYQGNQFIPTYPDARLKETMYESEETIEKGMHVLIFPEDSSNGYFEQLKLIFGGFAVLCERFYKKGKDIPVACCYYHKKTHVCVIDEPVKYSSLRGEKFDREAMTETLMERINGLAYKDPYGKNKKVKN